MNETERERKREKERKKEREKENFYAFDTNDLINDCQIFLYINLYKRK